MNAAGHLARARRQQLVAKTAIGVAAGLTILVLVLVMGLILVKGFWVSKLVERPVVDVAVPLATRDGNRVVFVVNEKVRVRALEFGELQGIYTGRTLDWGKISEQELDVAAFSLAPEDAAGAAVAGYLLGSEGRYGRFVTSLRDPAEILLRVAAKPGAVGFVPADVLAAGHVNGVRAVPVNDVSLIVHPSVAELVNNVRLRRISEADLRRIMAGDVASWSAVGGPDLPVTLVWPAIGSALETAVGAAGYARPAGSLPAASAGAEAGLVAESPGRVGFARASEVSGDSVTVLGIERRVSGPNLGWHYLVEEPKRSGNTGGISTIIINTLLMIGLTVLFSTPIGVRAAVYLVEYAREGRLLRVLRIGTETLAGVPSIIFGLFGFIFFVQILGLGIGLLSGTLTLTMMILPTIVRVTEEALKSVPRSLREGGLALGATKLETIVSVVLPTAAPGILTGVILGIGRAVGETAALIYTMGADYSLARGLFTSTRVLAVHLYLMVAEGVAFERAFASATVLIIIVLVVNMATTRIVRRFNRRMLGF